jgi:phosphonate degradation associated HDIG domain protein
MSGIVEKIIHLIEEHGDSQYGGEAVSQKEHALQAAHLAMENGENANIVVAGLLHDIGHLLHHLPDDAPEHGVDDFHEELANDFLKQHFTNEVVEPVRLHVAAKRYLCQVQPEYLDLLSEPSIVSLGLQGGPMTAEECVEFEKNPFYQDAVKLRKYDDLAKIPDLEVKPVAFYASYLESFTL